jgi:hypothetical protein
MSDFFSVYLMARMDFSQKVAVTLTNERKSLFFGLASARRFASL